MKLPASITLDESKPGFPILRIAHATCSGSIALLGAHVMEWTPTGQRPVLFMSADAIFEEGSPIRGGIPVCWPWFGPRENLPGHGIVRTRFWNLVDASESNEGVKVTLHLHSDGGLPGWEHAFEVELQATLGQALEVSLRMKHLGATPAAFTGALHTYLTVGAIEQTRVTGLDGTSYSDTIDHDLVKPQTGGVVFDREVDRVYQSAAAVHVVDAAWQRTLEISKAGSQATVVWNPWIEKSKRLNDLPDEAYHGFLCIEAANAGTDIIHLHPGEEHVLSTRVEVKA